MRNPFLFRHAKVNCDTYATLEQLRQAIDKYLSDAMDAYDYDCVCLWDAEQLEAHARIIRYMLEKAKEKEKENAKTA